MVRALAPLPKGAQPVNSQHAHGSSQPFTIPDLEDQMPSSGFLTQQACLWYTNMQAKHLYALKKKKKELFQRKKKGISLRGTCHFSVFHVVTESQQEAQAGLKLTMQNK